MEKKNFLKQNSNLIRSITFLVGVGLIFVAGLLFIVLVDLKIKVNTNKDSIFISAWLFFSIIFSIGGGIFYFAGDSMKHKHVLTLLLKGVGLAFSAFHIVFLNAFHTKINTMLGISKIVVGYGNTAYTLSLIFTIAAVVVMAVNYVLSIVFIQEDY